MSKSKCPPSCKSKPVETEELTKDQIEELKKLADELSDFASDVVEDYNKNPSENSGSIIQIHENSPFLYEWLTGDRWRRVLTHIPVFEELTKKKEEDDSK